MAGASASASPLGQRRLAELLQGLAVQLLELVPALMAGRPCGALPGAVQQVAVLCAVQARAIDPSPGGLDARGGWSADAGEELVSLAELALALAEQDLLARGSDADEAGLK